MNQHESVWIKTNRNIDWQTEERRRRRRKNEQITNGRIDRRTRKERMNERKNKQNNEWTKELINEQRKELSKERKVVEGRKVTKNEQMKSVRISLNRGIIKSYQKRRHQNEITIFIRWFSIKDEGNNSYQALKVIIHIKGWRRQFTSKFKEIDHAYLYINAPRSLAFILPQSP